jgi:hypothetical protein
VYTRDCLFSNGHPDTMTTNLITPTLQERSFTPASIKKQQYKFGTLYIGYVSSKSTSTSSALEKLLKNFLFPIKRTERRNEKRQLVFHIASPAFEIFNFLKFIVFNAKNPKSCLVWSLEFTNPTGRHHK